ncbi:hypothetical protein AVEN_186692-1, partial [Araneus ventricosus]
HVFRRGCPTAVWYCRGETLDPYVNLFMDSGRHHLTLISFSWTKGSFSKYIFGKRIFPRWIAQQGFHKSSSFQAQSNHRFLTYIPMERTGYPPTSDETDEHGYSGLTTSKRLSASG